jgi:hypothetical protein
VLERLAQLVDDVGNLNSKLILLIGPPRSGKTALLDKFSNFKQAAVLNAGGALGRQLLGVPIAQRHIRTVALLMGLVAEYSREELVLIDNIELLFDQTLQLNPLDLLKRLARVRRVIAAWPGELNSRRLAYATMGHPEHRDYPVDGFIPFELTEA